MECGCPQNPCIPTEDATSLHLHKESLHTSSPVTGLRTCQVPETHIHKLICCQPDPLLPMLASRLELARSDVNLAALCCQTCSLAGHIVCHGRRHVIICLYS